MYQIRSLVLSSHSFVFILEVAQPVTDKERKNTRSQKRHITHVGKGGFHQQMHWVVDL